MRSFRPRSPARGNLRSALGATRGAHSGFDSQLQLISSPTIFCAGQSRSVPPACRVNGTNRLPALVNPGPYRGSDTTSARTLPTRSTRAYFHRPIGLKSPSAALRTRLISAVHRILVDLQTSLRRRRARFTATALQWRKRGSHQSCPRHALSSAQADPSVFDKLQEPIQ